MTKKNIAIAEVNLTADTLNRVVTTIPAEELEGIKNRFAHREGEAFGIEDANGKDIYDFNEKYRNGRTGKMPNGESVFVLLEKTPGFPLKEKQLRRLFERWVIILEIRSTGASEPRLGVTHYAEAKRLGNTEQKLEVLQMAESEGLSVCELRRYISEKYFHSMGANPRHWRKRFSNVCSAFFRQMTEIHGNMEKDGGRLDADAMNAIENILEIINMFKSKKEAK